jgi:hypothetical protein
MKVEIDGGKWCVDIIDGNDGNWGEWREQKA